VNPGGIFDGVHDAVGTVVGDPARDVIEALEAGNFIRALDLADELSDDALRPRLEERLEVLEHEFLAENIEYYIVILELETIDRMRVSGLSEPIDSTRDFVHNLNNSRIAFSTAEALYELGEFAAAIDQYSLVIFDDPNYEDAMTGVIRATNSLRSTALETAANYSSVGNYESAIRVLNNALLTIPNDPDLTQQVSIYTIASENANRQGVLDMAADFANMNEWATAIDILVNALFSMPDDSQIIERIQNYEQSYLTYTLSRVDELVAENRHDEAVELISQTLRTLQDNDQLTRRMNEIEDARPTSLLAQEPVNEERWNRYISPARDSVSPRITWSGQLSSAEYYISEQYSTVQGRISANERFEAGRSVTLIILVDGEVAYETAEIQRTGEAEFEVSVVGAQFIEFRLNIEGYTTNGDITISDLFLTR